MKRTTVDWRRWLRRKIVLLLAFKLAALVALWLLFFSPAHRVPVDGSVISERLAPARDADDRPSLPSGHRESPEDA